MKGEWGWEWRMALRAGLDGAVPPALGVGKSGESRGGERLRGPALTTAPSLPRQREGAVRLRERWCGHTRERGAAARDTPHAWEQGSGLGTGEGKAAGAGEEAAQTPHHHSRRIALSACGHGLHAGGGPCGAGAPLLLALTAVYQGERAFRLAATFRAGSASRKRRAAPLRGSAGGRASRSSLVLAAVHH